MEDQAPPDEDPPAGPTDPAGSPRFEPTEAERDELAGAIRMVADRWAAHVLVCGLHAPASYVDELARPAEAAGVSIRVDRIHDGCIDVLVGPART